MIIVDDPQGSSGWHKARAGAITASMFAEVRKQVGGLNAQQQTYVDAIRSGKTETEAKAAAEYKNAPKSTTIARALDGEKVGDYTDAAKNYAFRLAIERISGEPLADEQFDTYAMRRGREMEPEAREAHEFERNITVRQTGLILTDDGKFGASADGLIYHDEGAEYKCYLSPEKIRRIILTGDISEETDQIQGCLWLSGRTAWQFCLYCPQLSVVGRALTIFDVPRDDNYIEKLERDVMAFDGIVCDYRKQLETKGINS